MTAGRGDACIFDASLGALADERLHDLATRVRAETCTTSIDASATRPAAGPGIRARVQPPHARSSRSILLRAHSIISGARRTQPHRRCVRTLCGQGSRRGDPDWAPSRATELSDYAVGDRFSSFELSLLEKLAGYRELSSWRRRTVLELPREAGGASPPADSARAGRPVADRTIK